MGRSGTELSLAGAATSIILTRQNFGRDKLTFIATNTCLSRQNTSFVATKICWSQQKPSSRHKHKSFIATKMMLMAASANYTEYRKAAASWHLVTHGDSDDATHVQQKFHWIRGYRGFLMHFFYWLIFYFIFIKKEKEKIFAKSCKWNCPLC